MFINVKFSGLVHQIKSVFGSVVMIVFQIIFRVKIHVNDFFIF